MKPIAGSQFRFIDFHIHTPASEDYKDKQATAVDIVSAAIQAGLDAIAITDHNTPKGVDSVRQAAAGTSLVVFPGVEINAAGGHIIALFDPSVSIEVIETALIEAGIGMPQWGKEEALAKDIPSVLAAVSKNGGIAIAAHADGPKGFLFAIQQGVARIQILKDPNLSAIELLQNDRRQEFAEGKVPGYDRPIACVQGSDAHSLTEIGKRITCLRMHRISLEGVRQAFIDPLLRISLADELIVETPPFISGLRVSQGFLSGQELLFNPGLNCLVGGAGSGKSTVLEFLRFALNQVSAVDQFSDDCFGKLRDLAGIGATINVTLATSAGEQILVARTFDDISNPTVVTRVSSGEQIDGVDIRGLFPIHAYSQGEAISISRNPLAQLELIDKHLDLSTYQLEIQLAYKSLADQITGLVKLEAKTAERESIQSDAATIREQIRLLNDELQSLQVARQSPIVTSHQPWIAERSYLTDLISSIEPTRREILRGIDDIDLPIVTVPFPQDRGPNQVLLDECRLLAAQLEETRAQAKQMMLDNLSSMESQIRAKAETWKKLYQVHDAQYKELQIEQGTSRMATISGQLEALGQKQRLIRTKEQSVQAAEKTLTTLLAKREELIELIRDRKARVRALRERKAKDFIKEIGSRISLKLIADGNRDEYLGMLTELMRGSWASGTIIEQICRNIHPVELAALLKAQNTLEIDKRSQIGDKWAQTAVDRAKAHPETVYELQAVPIQDLLEISLRTGENEYRPIEKLSTGQKATVIVLLTMVEGRQPVIFDQPEDALYTPFIYTDVVRTLRKEKDLRQFILATHNPNIAVGGDTDFGIVMEGTAVSTSIKASGGLDDRETQELMLWHLEGGIEAFRARQTKLGLK